MKQKNDIDALNVPLASCAGPIGANLNLKGLSPMDRRDCNGETPRKLLLARMIFASGPVQLFRLAACWKALWRSKHPQRLRLF